MTEITFEDLKIKNNAEAYIHYDKLSEKFNKLIESNDRLKVYINKLYGETVKNRVGSFKDVSFHEHSKMTGYSYSIKIGENTPITIDINKDDYNKRSKNDQIKKKFEVKIDEYLLKIKSDVLRQLEEKLANKNYIDVKKYDYEKFQELYDRVISLSLRNNDLNGVLNYERRRKTSNNSKDY